MIQFSKIVMTMRKLSIFAALVVAMTAVSCVKEMNVETPENPSGEQINESVTFKATFGAATKAVLKPGEIESKVEWEADDQVSVLVDEGNYLYKASEAGLKTTLVTEETAVPAEGAYYAVYPYDENAVLSEGVISTVLPAEQTAVLGSFTTHLSVSQAVENNFTFRNVCGLVKVTVDAENVTKIVFEGNSDEVVAGGIDVTVADAPTWVAREGEGQKSISLVAADGSLAKGAYYFAVLPQTFAAGFKVTAYKGEESWVIRNVVAETKIERSDIVGSKKFFEIEGNGTEANPYILKTPEHLVGMRSLATYGGETWFKMANDIDLKGINWVPVNYDQSFERKIHFDGGNFTISNLTSDKSVHGANYPSFMGVVYGSVKNLKFDNAVIKSTSGCGVVGGYVGTTSKPAVVENVTITNSSVTNAGDRTGGVCGVAKEATFKGVSFHGTVTSTYPTKSSSGALQSCQLGGFAGLTEVSAVFEECSVDADVEGLADDIGGLVGKVTGVATFTDCENVNVRLTTSSRRCGGLIGWNASTETTITNCHVLDESSVTFAGTSGGASLGGFIGFADTANTILEIKECSAKADITANGSAQNSAFIGQIGYASTVTIQDSYAEGDVTATGNYCGGLVSQITSSKVEFNRCHFSGNLTTAGSGVGFVGYMKAGTAELTISDSYATGTYTGVKYLAGLVGLVEAKCTIEDSYAEVTLDKSNATYVGGVIGGVSAKYDVLISKTYTTGIINASNYSGGIIGAAQGTSQSIKNCWSSMNVTSGGKQVGGLVGTATSKISITNSFASGTVKAGSVAGGIIGRVGAAESIVSNCIAWNPSVEATTKSLVGAVIGSLEKSGNYSSCVRGSNMALVNSTSTLADQNDITTVSAAGAYHGKAAAAGATISSVAKSIGWDETVWDLTGATPKLK